jgi:hypothetical protein
MPSQMANISPFNSKAVGLGGKKKKAVAHESCGSSHTAAYESLGESRVDKEAGILYGVAILGPESKNYQDTIRRKYGLESRTAAPPLYEGAKVNMDHPPNHNPNSDRDADKRFGKLVNVRFSSGDGFVRGDFIALKTHPMFERVFEAAADPNKQDLFGFSSVLDYKRDVDEAGCECVTEITRVYSVDLVADPATTHGLFESKGRNPMDEDTGMEQAPAEMAPPATSQPGAAATGVEDEDDGFEGSAFDAVLDDIGRDVLSGKLDDSAAVAKFKLALKLHGPDAPGEKEEEGEEEEGEEEGEGEEAKGEECESATAGTPAKPAKKGCSWEDAMSCLEAASIAPTKARVKAVCACESKADREELAATWKPAETVATPGTTGARPRSGNGNGSPKPASVPVHGQESRNDGKFNLSAAMKECRQFLNSN